MITEIDRKDSGVATAEPEQSSAVAETTDGAPKDSSAFGRSVQMQSAGTEAPTSSYSVVRPPAEAEASAPAADSSPRNSYAVVAGAVEPEPEGAGVQVRVQQVEEAPKPAANRTTLYVGLVVIFGLFAGFVFAGSLSRVISRPIASKLPPVTSTAYGLQGQIVTKWDDKLAYNLIIQPGELKQDAGFANAVSNPARPLSIDVQLKDPLGFVLCSNTVVLKFDPRRAAFAGAQRAPRTVGDSLNDSSNQVASPADVARLENQEIDRERGHDVFQNDMGADGRIASISAQGEIPCSKKAFGSIASWTFLPNFPTVSEQTDWLNHRAPAVNASSPNLLAARSAETGKPNSSRRVKRSLATPVSEFYIEGDDAMAGYDSSSGIIETLAGKIFLIDKTSAGGNALKTIDFPINIHYRCDESAACIISPAGAPLLHARIRR